MNVLGPVKPYQSFFVVYLLTFVLDLNEQSNSVKFQLDIVQFQ